MRVFAGVPLPQDAVAKVNEVIGDVKKNYKNLNFIKPGGLHITLFFFGELSEKKASAIGGVMEDPVLQLPVIQATFRSAGGLGSFPPMGNPRILFIDLAKGAGQIIECYEIFNRLISTLGYKKEKKPFVPHITIARNKREKMKPGYLKTVPVPGYDFIFDRIVLYKSVLSSTGADYFPLKTIFLGGKK